MSRITARAATEALPLFGTSNDTSLATMVGSVTDTSDGREFVLVQNGGTALVAGNVIQSVGQTTGHAGLVVTAYTAASATTGLPAQLTVTLTTVGVLPNEYQGGYLVVATATGIGQTIKIASHPGQTSTTGSVVLSLEDSPAVALDTTSTVTLFRNPYGSLNGGTAATGAINNSTNGVIVSPATTLTGDTLGVSLYAVAASTSTVPTYAWIQKSGPIACLSQGGTTAHRDVMVPGSVAGAVATYAVASGTRIGVAIATLTDAQSGLVYLQL